jgi:hypothetical protein
MGWSIGFREFSRRGQLFGEESGIFGEGDAEFGFDLTEGFDFVGHEVVGFKRVMPWFNFSVTPLGWLLWGGGVIGWIWVAVWRIVKELGGIPTYCNYLNFYEGIWVYWLLTGNFFSYRFSAETCLRYIFKLGEVVNA